VLQARQASSLPGLESRVTACRACPRLVAWREEVARVRRRAFANQEYWARPVPGWGDADPRILVIGLAPAAHGGNRTGRIFTGDASGDFLFAALHRAGLAAQATSTDRDDGQRLRHTRMVATVRCAPPDNKPLPVERDTCAPWLDRELALVLPSVRVVLALGGYAWQASLAALNRAGLAVPRPAPRFGHAASVRIGTVQLIGCYHPSQQNTFTGRLTPAMTDEVLAKVRGAAGLAELPPEPNRNPDAGATLGSSEGRDAPEARGRGRSGRDVRHR